MKSLRLVPGCFVRGGCVGACQRQGHDYQNYKDRYGQSCCDDRDCRAAADFEETVVNGQAVVRLLIDGTWITVRALTWSLTSPRTDGRTTAVAAYAGNNPAEVKPEPICVILPPRD